MSALNSLKTRMTDAIKLSESGGNIGRVAAGVVGTALVLIGVVGFIWDTEPDLFDVRENTTSVTTANGSHSGLSTQTQGQDTTPLSFKAVRTTASTISAE